MKALKRIFFILSVICPAGLHFIFAQTNLDSFIKNDLMKPSEPMINDLRINDDAGGHQQDYPAVAMNKFGYAVICWEDLRGPGQFDFRIYLQIVDEKGLAYKNNIEVSPLSGNTVQEVPDVAMDDRGHFVVVWMDDRDGKFDIYAQRFAANAVPIGSCFKVNEATDNQRSPAIAMNGAGDFVICWSGFGSSSISADYIHAQRYSSDGTPQGSNFSVTIPGAEYCFAPEIDMKEDGSFIITWEDGRNSSLTNIYARRFDSNGAALGTDFLVNLDPIDKSHVSPAVAVQENGKFMICYGVWSLHKTVYAHLYNSDGSSLIDYIVVPESAALLDNWMPAICATPRGGYSVVWASGQGLTNFIWGRNFDSAGYPLGGNIRVSDNFGDQRNPSIALDGRGAGITVWQDYRNSNWDIYGYGLGPLTPLNPTAGAGFADIVSLTWDPIYTYSNIDIYKIYRSTTSGGPYNLLATVDLTLRGVLGRQMRDYIDTNVTNGVTYYYKISAVVAGLEGPKSIEVSATPSSAGHGIISAFAATGTAPTIDGNITAVEWLNATIVNIANPYAQSPITLYVKNDASYLYLAIDDPNDPILDAGNLLGIIFNKNKDRVWDTSSPSNNGLIAISNATTSFTGYWGAYPNNLGFDATVPAVGISTGISMTSGHVQYEVSFNLSTSPLNVSPGETIGMAIMLNDPTNFYAYHYGYAAEWPLGALWEAAESLGSLSLVTIDAITENKNNGPLGYSLSQNYPNPFNPETMIEYQLPCASEVEISIFNLQGQKIATLIRDYLTAGAHKIVWNGTDEAGRLVCSGIYFCQLKTSEPLISSPIPQNGTGQSLVAMKKMLLLR